MRYLLILIACVMIFSSPTANGQPFPMGEPDSAYFGLPKYSAVPCSESLRMTIPVLFWTDWNPDLIIVQGEWLGNGEIDTIVAFPTGPADEFEDLQINIDRDTATFSLVLITHPSDFMGPTEGTELLLRFIIELQPEDSIQFVFHEYYRPRLIGFVGAYTPENPLPDTFFVAPDTLLVDAGDADASGNVAITDAVFIINYIFGGGCEPYDLNAADPDQSCTVTITDAVYLINYIFSGGPAPLPGCVVE